MKYYKIKSFAKVNLTLNVLSRLKSNFHRIESLITFIDLHDEIYIKKSNKSFHNIKFIGKYSKGIKRQNTISKLLNYLDKKNILKGKKYSLLIRKNIPQKSGMGGGSMNASSLLKYFLKKKIIKINNKNIVKTSNLIGSDVILGLDNRNSILRSNGNVQKTNNKLKFYLLIVKPKFGCSTNHIYKQVKEYSKTKIKKNINANFKLANLINGENDLEKIVIKKYPFLLKLKLFLESLPKLKFVRMTGSGSSFIAYFVSKNDTINASKIFKKKYKNYWSVISKTI
tara:strand:+ start:930 stop:1778 length:849 start_codon:yes stop_codon:yes gene_type:complete